ncbi:DUF11 domain-containing protein, partial [Ruegeria sp. XHP0148]|nr:DUF11 domain-containing protein [Ruegeria sp. XHP0148]
MTFDLNDFTNGIFLVSTHKDDYLPGETATITAWNVEEGGTVAFQVQHLDPGDDGILGTDDDVLDAGPTDSPDDDGTGPLGTVEDHSVFFVTDGGPGDLDGEVNGTIVAEWYVNPDDSLNELFLVTAEEVDPGQDGVFGTEDDVKTGSSDTTTFWDSGGDFSIDFVAAAPESYNHLTGGGAYDDRTIGVDSDVVESLEGGDFACGDIVTYFAYITVADTPDDENQTIELDFSFLMDTTGQSGLAIGDIVSVSINYGAIEDLIAGEDAIDNGINDDGGSVATLVSETMTGPMFQAGSELHGTVSVTDLEAGETVVVRIDTQLYCDPGSNPTGNLQAQLTSARTVDGDGSEVGNELDVIPGGAQTIPFKQVGSIGIPEIFIAKTVDANDDGVFNDSETATLNGDTATAVYQYEIFNIGNASLYNIGFVDDGGTIGDTSDDLIIYSDETGLQVQQLPAGTTMSSITGLTDLDGDGYADDLAADSYATFTWEVTYDAPGFGQPSAVITNTATATGDDAIISPTTLSDTDTATVTIPAIPAPQFDLDIEENTYSNGQDSLAGDYPTDPIIILAESPDDPSFTSSDVVWQFEVSLTGDSVHISDIDLTNDNGTPGDPGDDYSPSFVYSGNFVVGDTDMDNMLDEGETWIAEQSGTAETGLFQDLGTVTVTVGPTSDSAFDPSSYLGVIADIGITKTITDIDGDGTGTGPVDAAGDVISYEIVVSNDGTIDLTNVSLLDPLIEGINGSGLSAAVESMSADGVLEVGETWTYTGTYTAQQSDLDDNGGGDGDIDNTATVTAYAEDTFGNSTTPTADASVAAPVVQDPALTIDKIVTDVGGEGPDASADEAGDVITYKLVVTNTGNQTLTNVTVVDPLTSTNHVVASLAPDEVITLEGLTYAITQADIDNNGGGDGDIDNTATADSDQTDPVDDSEEVPVVQDPGLAIDKQVTGVDTAGDGVLNNAGEIINYDLVVTNTGNQTLTNVTVTDPLTGTSETIANLAVGESTTISTSYAITQADIDNNGGGDGDIDNTATAD